MRWAYLSILIFSACMNTSTQYLYSDGSANRYVLSEDTLKYIPIKPEESSTGFYSGGVPKEVHITTEQFATLKGLLTQAINTPSIHIPDRMKTSGMITVQEDSRQTVYIIRPGSPELTEIEQALRLALKDSL
jgi:hypothetical protein